MTARLQALHDPDRGRVELAEIGTVRAAFVRFLVQHPVTTGAKLNREATVGPLCAAGDGRAFDAESALADARKVRLVLRTPDQQGDGERQQQKTHSPKPDPNDCTGAFYTAGREGASDGDRGVYRSRK